MSSEDIYLAELLKLTQAGDRKACEALFRLYDNPLLNAIRLRLDSRVAGRGDAEDVLQLAYQEAWQQLLQYFEAKPLPFYPWLRRIVQDKILKFNRHHLQAKRSPEHEVAPAPENSSVHLGGGLMGSVSTPSKALAAKELSEKVWQALSQLDEGDRELLVMRYFENVSIPEAAQILDIKEVAAYGRHYRAIKQLRGILQGLGVSESWCKSW